MKQKHDQRTQEWFKQSDYDFVTAEAMFKTRRYIYTIFMCHLSIEKALKGLYGKVLKAEPPKIHDLINLLTRIRLEPPARLKKFISHLNQMSIVTRYPGNLLELQKAFTRKTAYGMLRQTEETLKWLKQELNKSF